MPPTLTAARNDNSVKIVDASGNTVGLFSLPTAVTSVRSSVTHQVVSIRLSNQRQGTAATKTRGEVRGGGRKPWRQKGTGRARQGSIRAPHWRKGGIAFGPLPRSFRSAAPRSLRDRAIIEAIATLWGEGRLSVVPAPKLEKPKTNEFSRWIKPFREMMTAGHQASVLLLVEVAGVELLQACSNLSDVWVDTSDRIDAFRLLRPERVLATNDGLRKLLLRVGAPPTST